MLAITHAATLQGVIAVPVTVEANGGEKGEPRCVLVGLPDAAVKESLDRILSSLANSGFSRPRSRVTINLAPGDLRKEGAAFDLPIALCLLSVMGHLPEDSLQDFLIAGELALSGKTRSIKGGLSMAMLAKKEGRKGVLLPPSSAVEASLLEGIDVFSIGSLAEAMAFLNNPDSKKPLERKITSLPTQTKHSEGVDFS